jgi:hypothetical protein
MYLIHYRFDVPEDKGLFFDNATRSRIVNFILRRKPFSEDKHDAYSFGKYIFLYSSYFLSVSNDLR